MNEFDVKRQDAIRLLDQAGIRRSNYLPPAVRLLWRLGYHTPLPHFLPFSRVAVSFGLFFAAAWGLSMWLFTFFLEGFGPPYLALASCSAGIMFGLSMASYYAHGRAKHNLPEWSELGRGGASAE